jgi:hypothetical protein
MTILRRFTRARSFSEPRSVALLEEKPEAYYEWGGPSQFEIDPFSKKDHSGNDPKRPRIVVKYRQAFLAGTTSRVFGTRSEHGPGINIEESVTESVWTHLSFNSSLGRGVVFHIHGPNSPAGRPKYHPYAINVFPDDAQEEGFYPEDIEDFNDIG